MINFFPELKKRRSDGLEDFRNPYEIYFGLFGEGDSGSGGSTGTSIGSADELSGMSTDGMQGPAGSNPGNMGPGGGQGSNAPDAGFGIGTGMNEGQSQGAGQGMGGVGDPSGSASDSDDFAGGFDDFGAGFASPEPAGFKGSPDSLSDEQKSNIADAFVTDSRGMPISTPGSPSGKLGGYLGKEGVSQDVVDKALDTLADIPGTKENAADKASQDVEDSYGVPVGIGFSPSVSATDVLSGAPTTSVSRALDAVNKSNVDRELDRLAASNRAALAGLTPAEQQARSDLMARNMDLDTPRGIAGLAVSDMTTAEMEQALADQFSAQQQAPAVGIATAPAVSASNVLSGIDRSNPNAMAAAERAARASVGQLSAEQLAAMDRNMPSMVDAETDIMARDLSDMNRAGYTRGLPDSLDLSGRNVTAPGAQFSTNLAGLTEQQKADQPFSMDLAQKIGSNPYGYEIDPVTGRVVGQIGTPPFGMIGGLTTLAQDLIMGPPQNTQDLIERGVYTGMTGVGGEGSDTAGDGFDEVVKAPTDPCPPGFVMKDGVCTPVEEVSDDAGGGSGNFVFQPPNAPPTFQPITQATPVSQINPFVLQPYPMPPIGINPPRPMQGIQTLSPTGAALGRQI